MNDAARKAFAVMFVAIGMMFALIGVGMIFGILLAGEPFNSVGGKVASVVFALGAVFFISGGAITPKGKQEGRG